MRSNSTSGLILFLIILLSSCQRDPKRSKEYDYLIIADIEECVDCQAKLFIQDFDAYSVMDSAESKNGRFSFKGKITQPGLYNIYYSSKADNTASGSVQVYLPTDSIHIRASKSTIRAEALNQPVIGSYLKNTVVFSTVPQQKQWEQQYLMMRDSLWQQYFTDEALVTAKFAQTFCSGNKALIEQWADSVKSFNYRVSGYWASAADEFVRQHPRSEVSLYAMLDNCNDRPSVEHFRRHYQAMPKALQAGFYGRILDRKLAANESRNQNSQRFVGSYVRGLAGKSPTGAVVDADQLFKQHTLTLVAFWASWCGPCRMEMPKYRRLYQQYNPSGFGMIGVSLDHNYSKWVQAIAKDSLQMPQLSELKGGDGEDIRRFAITGIPANLLVDDSGKIVAVDIPFPKLQKQLRKAL